MIGKRTAIWKKEEYLYEREGGEIPYLISYMHEDDQIRPAMIVVPGGAYRQVSSSEGDIVARMFYGQGYNVFVLTYSVNPGRCRTSASSASERSGESGKDRTLLCEAMSD